MKTLFNTARILLAMIFLVAGTSAWATPKELLNNIHKMRLLSAEALTNFYMYTGLDADAKYGNKISRNLSEFNTLLSTTRELPASDAVSESVAEISNLWDKFSELMDANYNDMQNKGFPDVQLVDEMARTNTELLKRLSAVYDQAKTTSGITPPDIVETARSLAITMEEITSQYAARGTSNLGQVFVGSYERSLEQMADIFRENFNVLKQQANNANSQRLLRAIDSKWNFMEKSIKNYNENTVPFLVTSYSERIIMNLEEVVAMHDL